MKNTMVFSKNTKYKIGQVIRHRVYPFRGIVFKMWIPSSTAPKNGCSRSPRTFALKVSEQNLVRGDSGKPVNHPAAAKLFPRRQDGVYVLSKDHTH